MRDGEWFFTGTFIGQFAYGQDSVLSVSEPTLLSTRPPPSCRWMPSKLNLWVDVNNLEMVRNYQRKTDKGSYSKEKLQEAMRAVQNGELSGYKAARLYNIPRMTIMDHVKNKRGKSDTLRRNTALSREVETKLASYLHLIERYGFGLTRDEVLEMVGEYDKPSAIWNLDETNFSRDPSKTKIVGLKGHAATRVISTPGKSNTTVLLGVNAIGEKIPPLIVFKGKNVWDQWTSPDAYPNTTYAATVNDIIVKKPSAPYNAENIVSAVPIPSELNKKKVNRMRNKNGPARMSAAKSITPKVSLAFGSFNVDSQLENDMENYTQLKIMGSVKRIRMRPNCIPSRFDCQPGRKRTFTESEPRAAFMKRQRLSIIKEIEETTINETCDTPLSSSSGQDILTIEHKCGNDKAIQVIPPQEHKAIQVSHVAHYRNYLSLKGFTLMRPPSVSSGCKLSKAEARLTKQIASLRIHVERVIRRVREFGMLKMHSVVNSNLIGMLDLCITTACALINLQDSLIK
ncbi:hypothetical protein EVAR_83982_1 [Eumeta japonica]|uniref:HTH psq-type domain-containing protein n=1 Tax=Eumeta variegata TaxID=151549 RepID=A0A4C1VPF9_EUMVA|nr:hypothetical protein EVAR_83982_1 [Eumeta japonica]